MSEASKFNDPVNPTVTTRLTYSRVSERTNNVASVARHLHICAAYSKHVLQRELKFVDDRAETARPSAAVLEDVERLSRQLAPLPRPSTPSWMRPSFQQFLGKAHAVRLGILVVRNVSAALREAAAVNAANVRRLTAALAIKRVRTAVEAIACLRQQLSNPATQPVRRDAPIESQRSDLGAERRDLEAEMIEAGRKRFFGYLAMERAKKLNGRRCNRARRFIAARPNRT